jgi:hypothetical protein
MAHRQTASSKKIISFSKKFFIFALSQGAGSAPWLDLRQHPARRPFSSHIV